VNVLVESLKVSFGAFLSASMISWFISGQLIPSLLVGGIFGSVAGFVAARSSTPRYTKE
jgi:hypothetical protein